MRVAVLGGGSIGGSIALHLKNKAWDIVVNDVDETIVEALKEREIEKFERIQDISVEMLLLCVPMNVEERVLEDIRFSETIMDVSSVMTPFVEIAEKRGLHFIGGHPMAGNERNGIEGWDPSMFEGKPFFLCKTSKANDEDVRKAISVVEGLDMIPMWLTPARHDEIVSKVSQSTFFFSLIARYIGGDFERFAGPGYESTIRLSKQNIEMVLDMIKYNRMNILRDLKKGEGFLNEVIHLVEKGKFLEIEEMLERSGS